MDFVCSSFPIPPTHCSIVPEWTAYDDEAVNLTKKVVRTLASMSNKAGSTTATSSGDGSTGSGAQILPNRLEL